MEVTNNRDSEAQAEPGRRFGYRIGSNSGLFSNAYLELLGHGTYSLRFLQDLDEDLALGHGRTITVFVAPKITQVRHRSDAQTPTGQNYRGSRCARVVCAKAISVANRMLA